MGCNECGEKNVHYEVSFIQFGVPYVTYVCDMCLYSFVRSHTTGQIHELSI